MRGKAALDPSVTAATVAVQVVPTRL